MELLFRASDSAILAQNGIVDPDARMMNSRHPGVFSARDLEREAIGTVNMSRLRPSIRLNQCFTDSWYSVDRAPFL